MVFGRPLVQAGGTDGSLDRSASEAPHHRRPLFPQRSYLLTFERWLASAGGRLLSERKSMRPAAREVGHGLVEPTRGQHAGGDQKSLAASAVSSRSICCVILLTVGTTRSQARCGINPMGGMTFGWREDHVRNVKH